MKKAILCTVLFSTLSLSAQEEELPGTAAVVSSRTALSSSTQNWIFAGSALITAAIGVLVTSMDAGANAHQ